MAKTAQKKEISGVIFQVAPFMAVEGLRLKAHLVRTFGPALGELLGGIDGKKVTGIMDMNPSGDSFAKGLEKLMEQLDEDNFIALIKRLLVNTVATVKVGGKEQMVAFNTDFDTAMELVFSGKLFSIYPLIGFVLKVNYPDFFEKVVNGFGRRIQTITTFATASATPPTESGTSEMSES